MLTKFHKSVGMAVITGLTPLLLAVAPVSAQTQIAINAMPSHVEAAAAAALAQAQPGTDVKTAGAPLAGWVTIAANSSQWYKFDYHYDDTTQAKAKKGDVNFLEPSLAVVQLTMDTPGELNFDIWTPGSLQNPVHNAKDKMPNGHPDHSKDVTQPVGVGTVLNLGALHGYLNYGENTNLVGQDNQQLRSDVPQNLVTDKKGNVLNPEVLTWIGGARASDTYYVEVINSNSAPAQYKLTISGSVPESGAVVQAQTAVTTTKTAPVPAKVATSATATKPGTDVKTAGAPSAGWVEVPANSSQWYKFNYKYDDSTVTPTKKGDVNFIEPSLAVVQLTSDTPGEINFDIWTPGSLQNPVHNPKDTKSTKSRGRVADHTNDAPQPVGIGTVLNLGTLHGYLNYSQNTTLVGQDNQLLRSDIPQPLVTDKKGNVLNPEVLTWVGGARASDTYYVQVTNSSSAPAQYKLTVSGPTVSN